MTANDSSEAVHKLIGECNNIDIVITDYHIPGLQLKKKIKEEFGNLPVIGVRVFLPTYRTLVTSFLSTSYLFYNAFFLKSNW